MCQHCHGSSGGERCVIAYLFASASNAYCERLRGNFVVFCNEIAMGWRQPSMTVILHAACKIVHERGTIMSWNFGTRCCTVDLPSRYSTRGNAIFSRL